MLKKALKLFLFLVLSVLLIIAAVGIHRAWDRYNPIDYWLVKYGYNEFIPPRSIPDAHKIAAPEMIAHGAAKLMVSNTRTLVKHFFKALQEGISSLK